MSLKNYFTLYTDSNRVLEEGVETNSSKPHSLIQWLVLLLGIVFQPFFTSFKDTGDFVWDYSWKFLLFAIIVALIAFPGIYRKAFDSDKPKWIQIIPIFTSGLGWQTLVDTVFNNNQGAETVEKAIETTFIYTNELVQLIATIA